MTLTTDQALDVLKGERTYQQERWNASTTETAGKHSFEEYIMYMEDYLAEAKHILSRESRQNARFRVGCVLRKAGALAVAAIEEHGVPTRTDEQFAKAAAAS
jgi:hypothetical protein